MFKKKIVCYLFIIVLAFSEMPQNMVKADMTTEKYGSTEPMLLFSNSVIDISGIIIDEWNDGKMYNVMLYIKNKSDKSINNWGLEFSLYGEIINIWNAHIMMVDNETYLIKNDVWNQDIASGDTVSFGLTVNGKSDKLPYYFSLITENNYVDERDYSVDFNIYSDWGTGYSAGITIKNIGSKVIEDWSLEFDFDRPIDDIWNGIIEEVNSIHYVINNASYNQNILPGNSVTIGFNGSFGNIDKYPCNYCLKDCEFNGEADVLHEYSESITIAKDLYRKNDLGYLFFDKDTTDLTGNIDVSKKIVRYEYTIKNHVSDVLKKDIFVAHNNSWTIERIPLVLGYNYVDVKAIAEDDTVYSDSCIIINYDKEKSEGLDVDIIMDTDGDGLSDYLEKMYGTDKNDTDTDDDGINDYFELTISGTNPAISDSDNDGIEDGMMDWDRDGISASDEINIIGTDPLCCDTDGDGLSDYDEWYLHKTLPLAKDTDCDGATDGWEIENGFNPLVFNEIFEVQDSICLSKTSYEVILQSKGGDVSSLEIEDVGYDSGLASIPGYIDDAISLKFDGCFERAKIVIEFDEELLKNNEFIPALYYIDEENKNIVEVKTEWDGKSNSVVVYLNHFSKYILLNKVAFDKAWENEFFKYTTVNIVFAIDSSASMGPEGYNNDPNNIRLLAAKEFVQKLSDGDQAAVLSFDEEILILAEFTDDKEELLKAIDMVGNSGNNTYINRALIESISLIRANINDSSNIIILLTDGKSGDVVGDYSNVCEENNIHIYTIGLGHSIDSGLLNRIATSSGGKYYFASEAEDIVNVYNEIENVVIANKIELLDKPENEDIDKITDTNNDGISDYYTKLLCDEFIKTEYGELVFPGLSYEDINNDLDGDYDNDGIKNGCKKGLVNGHFDGEITIRNVCDTNGNVKTVAVLHSNPVKKDSDDDGFNDYTEIFIHDSLYGKGTNPNIKDINRYYVDEVLDDSNYGASSYSNEYMLNELEEVALHTGSAAFNGRIEYINSYEESMCELFNILNEMRTGKVIKNINVWMKETLHGYKDDIKSAVSFLNNTFDAISITLNPYDYATDLIMAQENLLNCEGMIDDLLNAISEESEVTSEYLSNLDKLYEVSKKADSCRDEIEKLVSKYNDSLIDSNSFLGKPLNKLGQLTYKIPNGLRKTMKTIGVVSLVYSNVKDIASTIQFLEGIKCKESIYEEMEYIFDCVDSYSKSGDMKAAVNNMRAIIDSNRDSFWEEAMIVSSELSDFSFETLKFFLPKISKIGISVSLAYIIVDLVTGIEELNELSPQVIAIGDICHCVSKDISKRIKLDNEKFYVFDNNIDTIRRDVELLCQTRVVGENKYVSLCDARNILVELRDFFLYNATSADVYRLCAAGIYKIMSISSKYYFSIKLKYNGCNEDFYNYYIEEWS